MVDFIWEDIWNLDECHWLSVDPECGQWFVWLSWGKPSYSDARTKLFTLSGG